MWKSNTVELDISVFSPALCYIFESVMGKAVERKCRSLSELNLMLTILTHDIQSVEFISLNRDAQIELNNARALLDNHLAKGVSASDCRSIFSDSLDTGKIEINPFLRENWSDSTAAIIENLENGTTVSEMLLTVFKNADKLEYGSLLNELYDSDKLIETLTRAGEKQSLFSDDSILSKTLFIPRAYYLIEDAQRMAGKMGDSVLLPCHFMLAMAIGKDTYTRLIMKRMGKSYDVSLNEYLASVCPSEKANAAAITDYSQDARTLIENAAQSAKSAGRLLIGERDILAAMIDITDVKLKYIMNSVLRIDKVLLDELLRDTEEPTVIEPRLPIDVCDCINLSLRHGEPLVREALLEPIVRVFFRRKSRNVLLYGDKGVGMSTVGEMLAKLLGDGRFSALSQIPVIRFDLASPPPEKYDVAVEQALQFMEEEPDRIYFVEGFGRYFCEHFASCARRFSRNDYRLIVCVNMADYMKLQNLSEVLSDFIEPINVPEPSFDEAVKMTEKAIEGIEKEYSVTFAKNLAQMACHSTNDYLISQRFPKKSIDLLTRTAADVAANTAMINSTDRSVKKTDIAKRLSVQTGLPVETILGTGADKDYAYLLSQTVVGQEVAVSKVASRLDLIQKGMVDKKAPAAVFVFAGLSGTGKTELAKQIAQIYSSSRKLITFAMANFGESHSVSQMIGTPPGYVGYEEGGKLINDLNRDPYSVVLLDEIEKAHPAVWDPFLNLFDEGVITDMRGVTASGTQAFFVLTSNIGQYDITRMLREGRDMEEISEVVERQFTEHVHYKTGQKCFRPEFIGRIMRRGGIVAFNALSEEALRGIARHMFDKVARDYSSVHESKLICSDEVINLIAHNVYEENEDTIRRKGDGYFGGRRIDILMNEYVTNKLAKQIRQLSGAPMVRVVLNGSKTEIVPVFNDSDIQEISRQRKAHLLDSVTRKFSEITSMPDDAFDNLTEDKLNTLLNLLSQVQLIH